jgi:hypothetical protein
MTKIALLVAVMMATPANKGNVDSRHLSETDSLRRFGYAECLAKGYEHTPFGSDAEWVADLYRQLGRESRGDVYQEIRRAAEAVDPGKPAVVDKRNLAIFACLDFYESAQLKGLVGKAVASKRTNK